MPEYKTLKPDVLVRITAKILICCLLVTAVAGLSACSERSDRAARHLLHFGLAASPVTLDPRHATDATSTRINRLLYDRLVDFNDNAEAIPALADWTMRSPLHYRFTLRRTPRFHNGQPLTVADIKATYDYILDAGNASPHRATLSQVASVEIINDSIIDFYLNKPDPLFPGKLVVGIVPADLAHKGHPFNKEPIGSGPFRLLDWPDENNLLLERLSDGLEVRFIRVANPTVRVLKMLRGELDMMQSDLLPELVTYLRDVEEVAVSLGKGTNFAYIGFNMRDPVVSDPVIRQAIAHALDRQSIIKHVLGSSATPASAILPPSHWAGNDKLPLIPYDPDRARELLTQAGFTRDKPVHITYKTSNDPNRVRLATIIQNQLAQVGIEVEILSYDWGTFYGDIKAGRFQMYSLVWVGIKTPDIYDYVFHSDSVPPNGANRGYYSNIVVDDLIDRARQEGDLQAMAGLYRQVQEIVLDELPYVPLWYEDHVLVQRRGLVGYQLAPDGNYDGLTEIKWGRGGRVVLVSR